MKAITGILLVVIIAVVVGFVPIVEVPYTEVVEYQDTETYYVDEPYEDVEVYYEDEPYEVTETYTDNVRLSFETTSYVTDDSYTQRYETIIPGLPPMSGEKEVPIKNACVDVKNADEIAGSFTVQFSGFRPLGGYDRIVNQRLDISPGETKTAVCPADSNWLTVDDWSYDVVPSAKHVEKERTVTKHRQVEKEKTVTKYREVEKERTVTRERTETHYKKIPVFEYLLSRFRP